MRQDMFLMEQLVLNCGISASVFKHYDKKEIPVQFPMGYGLSYTTFKYSDIEIEKADISDQETVKVSCTVKNTGSCFGKEAVQLYVGAPSSKAARPVRELKGFTKVALAPGEDKKITFILDYRSFAYYETKIHDWFVDSDDFMIEIGTSSRDIRLQGAIRVKASRELPYHYTALSTVSSLQKTAKGRNLWAQMLEQLQGKQPVSEENTLGEGSGQMQQNMLSEMPLGAMVSFGLISIEELKEMIHMLNT